MSIKINGIEIITLDDYMNNETNIDKLENKKRFRNKNTLSK